MKKMLSDPFSDIFDQLLYQDHSLTLQKLNIYFIQQLQILKFLSAFRQYDIFQLYDRTML